MPIPADVKEGDVLVKEPGEKNRELVVLGTVFLVEPLEGGDSLVSYEAEGVGRSDKYQTINQSKSRGITVMRLVKSPHKEALEFLPPTGVFPGGIEYQTTKELFNARVAAAQAQGSSAAAGSSSAAAGGGGSKSRRTRRNKRRSRRSTRRYNN